MLTAKGAVTGSNLGGANAMLETSAGTDAGDCESNGTLFVTGLTRCRLAGGAITAGV